MDGGAVGLPDRIDLTGNPGGIHDKKAAYRRSLNIVFDKTDQGVLDPSSPIAAIKFLSCLLKRLPLFFDGRELLGIRSRVLIIVAL